MVHNVMDEPNRREVEDRLRESEARFQDLLEIAPDAIVIVNDEGRIVFVNAQTEKMFGYTRDELFNQPVEILLPERFRDLHARQRMDYVSTPRTRPMGTGLDLAGRRKDGSEFPTDIALSFLETQEGLLVVSVIRDITERVQAEEAVSQAERRYRELFEDAPVKYVITRRQEGVPIVTDCNRLFLSTLGYSRAEVVGRPLADFYTPESRAKLLKGGGYQRALRGEFLAEERELVTRDGRVVETLVRAVPETDPDGHIIGTRATYLDITRLKQIERIVRHQRDELAARARILSTTLRTTDVDERLDHILDEVLTFLGVEFGSISLAQGNEVVLRVWRGISDALRAQVLSFPTDNPPRWMRESCVVHEQLGGASVMPDFAKREGIQAWASIPLHLPPQDGNEGQWLGTLVVGSRRYETLNESEVQALQAMGDQLALAIDHAHTYRNAQERLARLQTLHEVDRAIIQSLDLKKTLHIVLERVPRQLGADAAAISLLDETQQQAEVFVMRMPNGSIVEEEAFELAESLFHWFVERQEPVIIYDLVQDPRVHMYRRRIRDGRLISYLGVPLVVRDQTIGILHILTTQPKVFADEDVAFFRIMAGQAAIAIENARTFAHVAERAGMVEKMLSAQFEIVSAVPERMTMVVLTSIHEAIGTERAGFFHYDREAQTLTLKNVVGVVSEVAEEVYSNLAFRLGEERGLVGLVAFTRQSLYLPDCHADPRWIPLDPQVRSAYFVPLTFGEWLFGVVALLSPDPHAFPAHRRTLVDLFAHYASAALQSARLLQDTRHRAAHLEALNAIIATAVAATDLPALLETTLERTLSALGLEMGAIWLRKGAGESGVWGVDVPLYITRGRSVEAGPTIVAALRAAGLKVEEIDISGPIIVEDWQALLDGEQDGGKVSSAASSLPMAVMEALVSAGVRASLAVPILVEGRRVGGLALVASVPRRWSTEEIGLVEAIARQVGAAVERLYLFQATQNRAEWMARLASLGGSLSRFFTVAGVVEAIGKGALTLSGADRAAVYLRSPDDTVTCPWSESLSVAYIEQVIAHPREIPGGRLFQSSELVLIPDVEALPEDVLLRGLAQAEGFRAASVWPLVYEGRVVAAVGCYYDVSHVWSAVEREVMEAFCRQAAVTLENARLFEAEESRREELVALSALSRQLVDTDAMETVLETIARQSRESVHVTFSRLLIPDENGVFICRAAHPVRVLERDLGVGQPVPEPAWALYQRILAQTRPRVFRRDEPELSPAEQQALFLDVAQSLCLVPLRAGDEAIGLLALGEARSVTREPFDADKLRLTAAIADQSASALRRARLHERLEESYIETVLALANAMDARDSYTGDHSQRLATWAEATARELGCTEADIETLRWGALLHDIGKIGVPDRILLKPGPLTDEEREIINRHPEIGAEIVAPVRKLADIAPIIRAHQEKWDGMGYPDGLKGEAIPLGARILAVVDAYGAITDERPYKPARSHEEAVAELKAYAGTQFDPQMVEAFLRVLERGEGASG